MNPAEELLHLAEEQNLDIADGAFAKYLDDKDAIGHLRKQFYIPRISELLEECDVVDGPAKGVDPDKECIYFAGQSLGPQPIEAKALVDVEMEKWRKRIQYGRSTGERPWLTIEDTVLEQTGILIGAKNPSLEVAIMNGLTINIHIGLTAFYQPTATRHKILIEQGAFPSDHYAVESQIRLHGHDPAKSLLIISPRESEETLRTEDIVALILKEGDSIALVYIPGIQFLTGQAFDIKAITEAAHAKGCYMGTDLAHAIGNIELHLTDWEVDFACWCNYKYVCASPAGIAGFYLHEKHAYNFDLPRMVGWWAHKRSTRFDYDNRLDMQPGAVGFTMTTTPCLDIVTLIASLNVFKMTDMKTLRKKSCLLTGYYELLLKNLSPEGPDADQQPKAKKNKPAATVKLVTPSDPEQRGCCLALRLSCSGEEVCKRMLERGIAIQHHRGITRTTPSPLFNTFSEVLHVYNNLVEVLIICIRLIMYFWTEKLYFSIFIYILSLMTRFMYVHSYIVTSYM